MRRSPTTASVAQMVDVPEATCVLYRLRSLLRVDSSIVQTGFIVEGLESGETKGACSEVLSLVIPGNSPLRADQDCSFIPSFVSYETNDCLCSVQYQGPGESRLGSPMERKAVSQLASRPFGVPQLSMNEGLNTLFVTCSFSTDEECCFYRGYEYN